MQNQTVALLVFFSTRKPGSLTWIAAEHFGTNSAKMLRKLRKLEIAGLLKGTKTGNMWYWTLTGKGRAKMEEVFKETE